jgi:hypothetical protein
MPKRLGSSEVIRVLQQHGFSFATQKGSHAKYKNAVGRIASCRTRRKNCPSVPAWGVHFTTPPLRSSFPTFQYSIVPFFNGSIVFVISAAWFDKTIRYETCAD